MKPPPPRESSDEEDRLDSWKAIATYLNRDVRTVQRWERREGLPVHRHQHDRLASVYAFRSELRQWHEGRTRSPNGADEVEPPNSAEPALSLGSEPFRPASFTFASRVTSRSTSLRLLSLVGVLAVALGVYRAAFAPATRPPASSRIAHLVMLPVGLGTSAPAAVGVEVTEAVTKAWISAGGEVLPDSVVRSAFPLMRRSSEQFLTAEVAREVAMRLGGVHVVLELRLDAGPEGYRLTLLAWAGPETRDRVAALTSVRVGRGGLAREVTRVTERVIEMFPAPAPAPTTGFQRVTVRSLEALTNYAEADRLMMRGLWEPAIPLLRQAISVEPEFASAYVHLAWVLSNLRKPTTEWQPLLESSMQLREAAGESERWFIAGSYYQLLGRDEEAIPPYERVLTGEPGHYWALGNLAQIRARQGQHDVAARLVIRRARANPANLVSQIFAADRSQSLGEGEAARAFRQQAAAVLHEVSPEERWIAETWLPSFDACEAWKRRDATSVAGFAEKLQERLASDGRRQPHNYYRLGFLFLDLGMTRRAEAAFARADERSSGQYLAAAAAARDDWPLAERDLGEFSTHFEGALPATGNLLVEANLIAEADRLIARWDRERFWPEHIVAPVRAALDVAHGRPADARRVLDASLPRLRQPELTWLDGIAAGGSSYLNALRLKARLLRDEGRVGEAIALLEEADVQRVCSAHRSAGFLWMSLRVELAALFRQQGRADRAEAVEADLVDRLVLADRDHAVLAAIKGVGRPESVEPASSARPGGMSGPYGVDRVRKQSTGGGKDR